MTSTAVCKKVPATTNSPPTKGLRCTHRQRAIRAGRNRPNLHVETDAGSQLIMRGKRAIGVNFFQRGKTRKAMANAEVILECGAIQSPSSCSFQAWGLARCCKASDPPWCWNLPGVGENLQGPFADSSLSLNAANPLPPTIS